MQFLALAQRTERFLVYEMRELKFEQKISQTLLTSHLPPAFCRLRPAFYPLRSELFTSFFRSLFKKLLSLGILHADLTGLGNRLYLGVCVDFPNVEIGNCFFLFLGRLYL